MNPSRDLHNTGANRQKRTARDRHLRAVALVVEAELVREAETFATAAASTMAYVLAHEIDAPEGLAQARVLLRRSLEMLARPALPDRRTA